jgi:hypothetical protein
VEQSLRRLSQRHHPRIALLAACRTKPVSLVRQVDDKLCVRDASRSRQPEVWKSSGCPDAQGIVACLHVSRLQRFECRRSAIPRACCPTSELLRTPFDQVIQIQVSGDLCQEFVTRVGLLSCHHRVGHGPSHDRTTVVRGTAAGQSPLAPAQSLHSHLDG